MTDLDVVRLLAVLHEDPDPLPGSELPTMTVVSSPLGPVGVAPGAVLFPGTRTPLDVWVDFDAFPVEVPPLGPVHAGFLSKPALLKSRLDGLVGNAPLVGGHSLGAADAEVYASLRLLSGRRVGRLVTFGSPMPGTAKFRDFLAAVPATNYRCVRGDESDPVTEVPVPIPIVFPCLQYRAFTDLEAVPVDDGKLRLHHAAVYAAALRLGGRPTPTIS